MLPKNFVLTVRNLAGATVDVKVIDQDNTVKDDGAGQLEPVYAAESTILSNAALADTGTEDSANLTNSLYVGKSGVMVITPAATADGRVELWLRTADEAFGEVSSIDNSRHLLTVSFESSSSAATGSYQL